MEKNTYPGKFIVLEGLDGSGQSTQAELLKDFLLREGHQIVLTKEPTLDSEAGKKIKKALDKKTKVEAEELQKLFTEDRKDHIKNLIKPTLKAGKMVISDRYFFSTFAYGVSDGLDLNWLIKINDNFLLPDLTFILKVSPEVCLQRIEKRGGGIKLFEKKEKLARVWQTYEILPSWFENVYMIDGEKSIKEVFPQIKEVVLSQLLNNKQRRQ